ncbi:hypothetical protein B0A48_03841 [Cryoendolithus antarcticus]|uniref:F-box domain-containing protein n=1 Tax=Cryoendolithus antarcticus TaxID=1507870 RepID=A0A1V8TGY8_9PEZI|nr:hypothetical protein B0A48_03841 [Cryoendolithus antarcticus]
MARGKPAAKAIADDSKVKRKSIKAAPPPRQRVTRAMTARSVPMAVFNTAELLERILLQLEPKIIFGVQRVCTQFRDILASSPRLREMCWLRLPIQPTGHEIERWVSRPSATLYRYEWVKVKGDGSTQKSFVPVQLSPFFGRNVGAHFMASYVSDDTNYRSYNSARPIVKAVIHGQGSRLSLLGTQICDPPCDIWIIDHLSATLQAKPPIYAYLPTPLRVTGCSTLGQILDRALAAKAWAGSGQAFEQQRKQAPGEAQQRMTIAQLQCATGLEDRFRLNLGNCWVHPHGTVITTEQERGQVA